MATGAGAVTAVALPGCGGPEVQPAPGLPRSDFGPETTAEDATDGLDLAGRLAVVTGCTSGIGFETMRVLALRGAYVVGTGRTLEKAEAACRRVRGVTTPVALELGDVDSILECAEAIRGLDTPVDILVCNAGLRAWEYRPINGLEQHFAVNHLGHFLLVNRLLDRLYVAWQGRIVVVSSRTAYRDAPPGGIDFDSLDDPASFDAGQAYGQSKLANALFSFELARRLRGTRITSNALHPGVINTEIDRGVSAPLQAAFALYTSLFGKTIEQGAATTCYVGTSPALGEVSGEFFEDCNPVRIRGDNHLRDAMLAERLWAYSEDRMRAYLVKHQRPDWGEIERRQRPVPR